jgi:hypothetical protein
VDPLPVAGGAGEQVDLLLGDGTPPRVSQVLAGRRAEFVDAVETLMLVRSSQAAGPPTYRT